MQGLQQEDYLSATLKNSTTMKLKWKLRRPVFMLCINSNVDQGLSNVESNGCLILGLEDFTESVVRQRISGMQHFFVPWRKERRAEYRRQNRQRLSLS